MQRDRTFGLRIEPGKRPEGDPAGGRRAVPDLDGLERPGKPGERRPLALASDALALAAAALGDCRQGDAGGEQKRQAWRKTDGGHERSPEIGRQRTPPCKGQTCHPCSRHGQA
ncbi:MAG: hypothetical protein GVY09_12645 [Gammaproteobacteria bacterium]|jgi:hypothetical protein|nr:hypothetical protein [Gammaproteobacteria bacterium]